MVRHALGVALLSLANIIFLIGISVTAYALVGTAGDLPLAFRIGATVIIATAMMVGLWSIFGMAVITYALGWIHVVDRGKDLWTRALQWWAPERVVRFDPPRVAQIGAVVREQQVLRFCWGALTTQYGVFRIYLHDDVLRWCADNAMAPPQMIPKVSGTLVARRLIFQDAAAALAFKMRWG